MVTRSTDFNALPLIALQEAGKMPWYHFSIDDVIETLIEVTDKNIPLFDHPTFALLKELHDAYGLTVDLYLFFQKEINGKIRTLREVRDLTKELHDAGDWLHFGPHALEFDISPFAQTPEEQVVTFNSIYEEIDRFAGKAVYAKWVRLHYYSESYELAEYFKEKGVAALFSTDRPVGSYRMPDNIKALLTKQGSATFSGANFIRTQFRVEFFTNDMLDNTAMEQQFKEALEKYGYIIIYTHEYEFVREDIVAYMRKIFGILNQIPVVSVKPI